jgi:hypothetical protein
VFSSPDTWRRILESGALAPSGDNLQPWKIGWEGDTLRLSVDTSRDQSLYNFQYRASLIAIGAMIENIVITAPEFGLTTQIEWSSEDGDPFPVARVTLRPGASPSDPLFPFIARRCTNRRPYAARPIASSVLQSLRAAIPADGRSELQIFESRAQRQLLARAASLNDRLLFKIRPLHDQFFKTLRWTRGEAEATRDGLFFKTLELGPLAQGFKAMRSWNVVRVANAFGASFTAPVHSYLTFMRSGAFGFLQMSDSSREAFIDGGRRLQRLWLTATSLGLSFQPMAGMLYLLPYLRADEGHAFGGAERSLLLRAEGLLKQALPLDSGKAAIMLFRIGYGPSPTATSLRRPIESTRFGPAEANSQSDRGFVGADLPETLRN